MLFIINMALSKNIALIILFLENFIEIGLSPRTTNKDKKCIDDLLDIFGWEHNSHTTKRIQIPKLAFQNKLYYMLVQEDYMLPLRKWCDGYSNGFKYSSDLCYNRLCKVFYNSNDPTEILKDAYFNLVLANFGPHDYAYKYFQHLLEHLHYTKEFMTPLEICQGKTEAVILKRKKRTDTETDTEIESSALKYQRDDSIIEQELDAFFYNPVF